MKIKFERQKINKRVLKIQDEGIEVSIPDYHSKNDKGVKGFNKEGLEKAGKHGDLKFSQSLTRSDLLEISNMWLKKLKVKPKRIQIRKMKNKWSSCSSKGNVTFSSELILLPRQIAEYAIVHELLHLIVPNHGKTFKVLLSTYLPNWGELHSKLNSLSRNRLAEKIPPK